MESPEGNIVMPVGMFSVDLNCRWACLALAHRGWMGALHANANWGAPRVGHEYFQ
jgi:hypothetical protein